MDRESKIIWIARHADTPVHVANQELTATADCTMEKVTNQERYYKFSLSAIPALRYLVSSRKKPVDAICLSDEGILIGDRQQMVRYA